MVYLAEDLRHERQVALKVLRPELAAALGPERFVREIKIAAGLRHPHILPLYDSGDANGLLYYVMPYVPGESLRDRLTREKQLPVEDALRIAREVADALSFAHSHGFVHRDVKPENILLEAGHAVVADFGIARAITAAGGERLTETGLAIGTPTYMSPEQAAGSTDLDGRSDLYSLGCVLYEMLVGEPPFTGPTVESVVRQHLTTSPTPVSEARPSVPERVAATLSRALAKLPADRFATAEQFAEALGGAAPGAIMAPSPEPVPARRTRPPAVAGIAVAVLAVAAVMFFLLRPHPTPSVNSAVVAVLPFRVASADASLQYLREGMVDLLAAKFTGQGGPRAVDPRTAIHAWEQAAGSIGADIPEDESITVGRRVGAGQVLLGSVVGTAAHVELQGRLVGVPSGETRGQAQVSGNPDSLPWLVDALAGQLLARQAGEGEQRLVQLTSTSLPALRAYLDGQVAYRRAQYRAAGDLFNRALDLDSTFALAALGLIAARVWVIADYDSRGVRLGWRYRDRLSERDRALLTALAGPAYPQPTTDREQLEGFSHAAELAPDRAEAWYWMGEMYYHYGALLEIPSSAARAEDVFNRALGLDSSFLAAAEHLVDLAAARGDVATVERVADHYLAVDSTGDLADYIRWERAVVVGDSAWLVAFAAHLADATTQSLRFIAEQSMVLPTTLDLTDRIVDVLTRRADPPVIRFRTLLILHAIALDRGRSAKSRALMDLSDEVAPTPWTVSAVKVLDGLFGDGDRAAAATAARTLQRTLPDSLVAVPARCMLELWHVAQNTFDATAATIAELRAGSLPENRPVTSGDRHLLNASRLCATILEALLSAHGDRPDAAAALERLDSLMRQGPITLGELVYAGNFTAARLHERRGELEAAIAAVRRYAQFTSGYLPKRLREEGRLAERVGDRDAAIRAYRQYLALRSHPEPALAAQVEQVRQALARLVAEPGS